MPHRSRWFGYRIIFKAEEPSGEPYSSRATLTLTETRSRSLFRLGLPLSVAYCLRLTHSMSTRRAGSPIKIDIPWPTMIVAIATMQAAATPIRGQLQTPPASCIRNYESRWACGKVTGLPDLMATSRLPISYAGGTIQIGCRERLGSLASGMPVGFRGQGWLLVVLLAACWPQLCPDNAFAR
jgi:hypothetical protein